MSKKNKKINDYYNLFSPRGCTKSSVKNTIYIPNRSTHITSNHHIYTYIIFIQIYIRFIKYIPRFMLWIIIIKLWLFNDPNTHSMGSFQIVSIFIYTINDLLLLCTIFIAQYIDLYIII